MIENQQHTDAGRMKELYERHIAAEKAGDVAAAVSVYTEDVVHDVVGMPGGANHGLDGATHFYEHLTQDLDTEEMLVVREQFGEDFCVVEHDATCVVRGSFAGVPGNNRRVSFRMLHVWDFRDGLISREQVWLDGGAIIAQLTA